MTLGIATRLGVAVVACAVACSGARPSPTREADTATSPQERTRRGAVASDHEVASRVGARVLEQGGNAVDAAVATAFALGVVNPSSSGIGGGGFAVVHDAATGETTVIDFRETAPAALTADRFVKDGEVDTSLSRSGGLAVGVPGEVAGLAMLVERFGSRTLAEAIAPAEELAREGFPASSYLAYAARAMRLRGDPDAALLAVIAPGGDAIAKGERITRPRLAETLRVIAAEGPQAFYRGAIAEDLVAAVTAAGGVMTAEDLAGYRAVEREPRVGAWGARTLAAAPLPSSGGIVLLELLGILDAARDAGDLDLEDHGAGSAVTRHVVAEVLKHGFADRARFLGDADPAVAAGAALLAPERLRALARTISLESTRPHDSYGGLGEAAAAGDDDRGTSHLCVIDGDGNAVALTTTVNGYFGAGVVGAETGVVLNNQIDDFALAAGVPNMFGLVQSEYNLVGPGKRPLSSMSPTLVFEDGRVVGCVGGSGGPRIISASFQVLLDSFVFGMDAEAAVAAPRVHHQWTPDVLRVEPEIPEDVRAALVERGHEVEVGIPITAVQLIRVTADGTLDAASDPRKGGAPAHAGATD